MQTLHQATAAREIHRQTGVVVGTVLLPEGTVYRMVHMVFDPMGYTVKRIKSGGRLFEILE